MFRHTLLLSALVFTAGFARAQENYTASAGEMIFSYGQVDASIDGNGNAVDINGIVRWSPVFNFMQQFHFDFNNNVGLVTGLGLRNVGLISDLNYTYIDPVTQASIPKEVTIKERSYALGLPVALKLGDFDKNLYVAVGGEAELMFAYKRKIMDGDDKLKTNKWFYDNVNIFNPSVFADFVFFEGTYIRFKYYLMDFLDYTGITLKDGTVVTDYGTESPLFYVSIGQITFKKKLDQPIITGTSAYFRTDPKSGRDN